MPAAPSYPAPLPQLAPRRRRLRTVRTVGALMLREMSTTYGRSPGGYIWAVLEPVAVVSLMSVVFSLALRSPSLGTSFALFYASGYLPFQMFLHVANVIGYSIRFSRPLLAYPTVSILDAVFARFVLNILTKLMVFYVVSTGLMLLLDTRNILQPAGILSSLAMSAAMALGVGTLNCYLIAAFPLWERVWKIVTRPLFILSGVLFIYEDIPGMFREIAWWNPLFHVTGEMRRGFYATYEASYVSPLYVYGIALLTFTAALMLLRRYGLELLNK